MPTPKKNTGYIFYTALVDAANPGSLKANPTIAAGDFQISTDGAAFDDIETLPVVEPAGSVAVKVALSSDEMNGDKVLVQGIDAAGAEWQDVLFFLDLGTVILEDVAPAKVWAYVR